MAKTERESTNAGRWTGDDMKHLPPFPQALMAERRQFAPFRHIFYMLATTLRAKSGLVADQ